MLECPIIADLIMVEQKERVSSHLLGLLNPAMVIAGNLIAIPLAMENSAWAPFVASIGAIWMLGLGPLIETLLGDRPPRVGASESGGPFHALLFLHALCHFGGVLSLLWLANSIGFSAPSVLILACLSTGIVAGVSGIIVAHELGHMRPKSVSNRLARLVMGTVLYGHFTDEHNITHHKHVATDADPASARRGETVWGFVVRTVPGQLVDAIGLHDGKGRTGLRNPVRQAIMLELGLLVVLLMLDPVFLIAFLGQAIVGIFLLEYVNYIQHYGLRRMGKERKTKMHSWQSERRWSSWTLLNLNLHPSHHLTSSLPYWKARSMDGAPTLPSGYYGCFWLAMIPPLWRRAMHPRLDALVSNEAVPAT